MLLLIDNYDSFTFNLVQLLGELNFRNGDIFVVKNDEISVGDIEKIKPSHIVISPGPGIPSRAGITLPMIEKFHRYIPVLGVCLGFQAIAEVFGARLVKAPRLFHGKTSFIYHQGEGLFGGVENPFEAMRYHSWVIDPRGCDSEIEITAYTGDGIPMALQAKHYPVYGVQFHPESILTKEGRKVIGNFFNSSKPFSEKKNDE